jgi:hypothetical protein
MSLQPFDEKVPLWRQREHNAGHSTASYNIWGPYDYPTRIDAILGAQNDTIVHAVNFALGMTTSTTPEMSASVPIAAGFSGNPAVDLLSLALPATVVGLVLPPGACVNMSTPIAMVGSSVLELTLMGGSF